MRRACALDANHMMAALHPVSPVRERMQLAHRQGFRFGTCMPIICEVEAGIIGRKKANDYRRALQQLLEIVKVWPFDLSMARRYGKLYRQLKAKGKCLSAVDIMLAAMALEKSVAILTADKDFAALPDLKIENWLV